MKIVVLDGYCANPGDLSWDAIASMGELVVYDRTAPADVLSRAQGAQALYTNKTVLSAETLRQLPECKFIGVLATGFNIVDTKAAKELGITNGFIQDGRSVGESFIPAFNGEGI